MKENLPNQTTRLRELLAKITLGEWYVERGGRPDRYFYHVMPDVVNGRQFRNPLDCEGDENLASFICLASNAMPALLDALERKPKCTCSLDMTEDQPGLWVCWPCRDEKDARIAELAEARKTKRWNHLSFPDNK